MTIRRPRIPGEMAQRIDAVRGQVPFERWVRQALEQKLDGLLEPQIVVSPSVVPDNEGEVATPAAVEAQSGGPDVAAVGPAATIGQCWEPWCEKRGPVGEVCPAHPKETFR